MVAWSCSLTSPLLKDDTTHPSLQEREAPHRCWSGSSSVRLVAIGPGITADLGIWGRERLSQHRPAGSRWRNFSARAEAVTSGWETSSRFAPCWRERAGSGLFLSYSALQMGKETPGPEEVLVPALYRVRMETSPLHSPGSSGR